MTLSPYDAAPPAAVADSDVLPDISGKQILIFGINYAPEPTGIAPYTTGMARYLVEQGARVTVVTGLPHYPSWTVEAHYRRGLLHRELDHGVEVLRIRHTVPAIMTAGRRAVYEATFLAHAMLRSVAYRPDLILAVSPALGGALAGATMARISGVPLVVVVQDLMAKAASQSGITGGSRSTRLTSRLESAALVAANSVLVVSEGFREGVLSYGIEEKRVRLMRNWTHIAPVSASRSEARRLLGWDEQEFLAIHTGNMGFKQNLENVIDASRQQSSADPIRYVLVGGGSQRESLRLRAENTPYTRFVDSVDDNLYPLVLAAADVLLVNERPSVAEMSLPSKLTSYLVAGKPIVAAVAAGGATAAELAKTDAALVVPAGDPSALDRAVRQVRNDEVLAGRLSANGREYAESALSRAGALSQLHRHLARELSARPRPLRRPFRSV